MFVLSLKTSQEANWNRRTGGQTNLCIRRLRLKIFYLALDMNLNLKSNLELNLKLNQEPSRKLFGCLNINLQMSVCGL